MKNKNIKKAFLVLTILVAGTFIIGKNSEGNKSTNVIKIGVIAPQSGPGAAFGLPLMKGVEMALNDLGASSASTSGQQYEVIYEDDGGSASKAASAAQKLISTDGVKAILTVTGVTANAVKPIAESAHIIHIADTADSTVGSGNYNFTNSIVPSDEMPAWLKEAKERGTKKLAVIYQKHPGILPSVNLIQSLSTQYGIEISSYEGFDSTQSDFRTIALKAKSSGADTYFIAAYPPSLDIISKSLKEIGQENISTYSLFAISPTPEIYNGKWYTDANLSDTDFMAKFKALYPDIRFNVRTAPYGYDMFMLSVNAIKSGDASNYLKKLDNYSGKVGKIIKSVNENNFRSSPAVWTIENGVPKIVKMINI